MKSIDEVLHDNSRILVGDAISRAWNTVSKKLGFFVLAIILFILIPGLVSYVLGLFTPMVGFKIGIGLSFIGSLFNNIVIMPVLSAGFVYVCWQIDKGEGWDSFGEWFKGLDYIKELVIQVLIYFGITLLLSSVLIIKFFGVFWDLIKSGGAGAFRDPEQMMELVRNIFSPGNIMFFIFYFLFFVVISIIWVFRIHFLVIYNMTAWNAMEASRHIAQRNFFQLLGLFFLLLLINLVGCIPCFIGLLFTIPMSIAAVYHAFAQITKSNEVVEIIPEDPTDTTVTMY